MKTLLKIPQTLSILLFFTLSTFAINPVEDTPAPFDKWKGTWEVESDHYVGTVKISMDGTGEFLNADITFKNKRTNKVVYRFRSVQMDIRKVRNSEITVQGVGKRASDKSKFSIKLNLVRYATTDKAVGAYQIRAGTGTPSGMKSAIQITK